MITEGLLHCGGHHDDADGRDQQEVEGVHEACPRGLLDLGAAAAAAGAGRRAATARQLREKKGGETEGGKREGERDKDERRKYVHHYHAAVITLLKHHVRAFMTVSC